MITVGNRILFKYNVRYFSFASTSLLHKWSAICAHCILFPPSLLSIQISHISPHRTILTSCGHIPSPNTNPPPNLCGAPRQPPLLSTYCPDPGKYCCRLLIPFCWVRSLRAPGLSSGRRYQGIKSKKHLKMVAAG